MKKEKRKEWIAILDFGSQYTQLIAKRIREAKVYSEILPCSVNLERIQKKPPKGIILSGGPASVYEDRAPVCDKKIFELGIPILGICYGAQLIAQFSGGKVIKTSQAEYGRVNIILDNQEDIFYGFPKETACWMSHQDLVEDIPDIFYDIYKTFNIINGLQYINFYYVMPMLSTNHVGNMISQLCSNKNHETNPSLLAID